MVNNEAQLQSVNLAGCRMPRGPLERDRDREPVENICSADELKSTEKASRMCSHQNKKRSFLMDQSSILLHNSCTFTTSQKGIFQQNNFAICERIQKIKGVITLDFSSHMHANSGDQKHKLIWIM